MKVICDRAALLDAVNLMASIAPARSPKPQLSCVHLCATKDGDAGRLTLTATDAEVSLRLTTLNVDVNKPGEALVNAQKLQQIVAAEDAEATLTIEVDGDQIEVRGADAKFRVFGFPPAEFPPAPEFLDADDPRAGKIFTVQAASLETLVGRTLFATARETSRYAINGVLLSLKGKKLELVATDGRRLALARGHAEASADTEIACIIPSKAMQMASKLIDDPDENIRVAITDNQVIFGFNADAGEPRAVLASALVEGAFPPYEDVIPTDQDKRAVFDAAALRSGVRRAALLTNEESRGVRMNFTNNDGNSLRVSSRAPEMGEAEIDVNVDSYDGDAIEIGFNPTFLIDALKVVDEPQVVIEMKAPNKPGLIKAGADFVYVVMPVSLQ